jgi:hypothetical protein
VVEVLDESKYVVDLKRVLGRHKNYLMAVIDGCASRASDEMVSEEREGWASCLCDENIAGR